MWSSIKNFFYRHRRKFIVSGVVIAGVYAAAKYAQWRVEEWKDAQEREYIEHARKQHHFESNQRTCSITLYSLIPSLKDSLLEKLNSEELTAKLRDKNANVNKVEVWEKLKVLSFSRTISAVYSSCLLFVFLRIQLNIVGGYMYLDSVDAGKGEGANGSCRRVPEDIQKKYLALVKYLLSEGLEDMIRGIERATEAVLQEVSLKEKFTAHSLTQLINHIRQTFEFTQHACHANRADEESPLLTSSKPFCQFMVPVDLEGLNMYGDEGNGRFLHLVEETLDVLESDDCIAVVQSCLDAGFKHLMTNVGAFFEPEIEQGTDDPSTKQQATSLPLAKIIPIMNGQIHHLLSEPDNHYIQDLFRVKCTGEFAANVYEAFCSELD